MITVYLKPTNYCNVGCSHCYLPLEVRADRNKITNETFENTILFVKNMMKKENHQQVFWLWHGGEPLMLKPEWYLEKFELLDKHFSKDELIEGIQTSLIPYTKKFAPIALNRWNGFIGSSIDFTNRLLNGSAEAYQNQWLEKVNLAREDNIDVIPTITPSKTDCLNSNYIYSWLKKNQFPMLSIDRYTNMQGDAPDFPSNTEHSLFLQNLFDEVIKDIKTTKTAIFIKPLAACIVGILHDIPGDRWGGSCQKDFIVVNPNGSLNNCPDKDSFEKPYGNINLGFSNFQSSPERKKWIRLQVVGHRIDECSSCENKNWCKSGCPITGNACQINGITDECSGYKRLINKVRAFMKNQENKQLCIDYVNYQFMQKKISVDLSIHT